MLDELKQFKKEIKTYVSAILISIGACFYSLYSYLPQDKKIAQVKVYVESNLTKIIKEQEEKLEITHFGVPKVSFGPPIKKENEDKIRIGEYSCERDEIYIGVLSRTVSPEKTLSNVFTNLIFRGQTFNVKGTLDHELGHFYVDKLNEDLRKKGLKILGDWANRDGMRIVHEGVAEYFREKMNPESYSEFEKEFCLVKPIIDAHGKRGIGYLVLHPPTQRSFASLQEYQERALQYLSREKTRLH